MGSQNMVSASAPSSNAQKRDIDSFMADIERAVKVQAVEYTKVTVLMIRWVNDDLNVKPSQDALRAVLEKVYNFTVLSYVIPVPNRTDKNGILAMQQAFQKYLNDHVALYGQEDSLTIYVYSGHGAPERELSNKGLGEGFPKGSKYILGGTLESCGGDDTVNGPYVNWTLLSENIEEYSGGDVLYIFDSCYSGMLTIDPTGAEVLAAASWDVEASAAADSNQAFTDVLVDQLKLYNGKQMLVADIFGDISRGMAKKNVEVPPFHCGRRDRHGLVLQRCDPKPTASRPATKKRKTGKGKAVATSESQASSSAEQPPAKKRRRRHDFETDRDHVLISVRIEEEIQKKDLDNWVQWLATKIPAEVDPESFHIEGIWKTTNSQILLVRLPIEVWSLLPIDDEAYEFISYVGSRNLIAPALAAQGVSFQCTSYEGELGKRPGGGRVSRERGKKK